MEQSIRRLLRVGLKGGGFVLGLLMLVGLVVLQPVEVQAQKKVTLKFEKVPFSQVLGMLKEKTNYEYFYNDEEVKRVGNVSGNFTNASVEEILRKCLNGTGFGFKIENNVIIITPPQTTSAAQKKEERLTVNGRVVDETGMPMVGVTVMIKGQRVGTSTDGEGEFSFGVPSRSSVLVLSFIGMKSQEILVSSIKDLSLTHKYTMHPDSENVEEVVVTGYGTIRKSSFTGASITVSKDELMKVSKGNALMALQAFDPSFRIQENSLMGSNPNAVPELYIRGRSGIGVKELDKESMSKASLVGNPNLPLFIMDGFQVSVQKFYDMDMNRIESITIHKDAAATALYGSRAANGVIIITTVAPKAGEVMVDYNMTATVSMPDLRDYNLMNASEKLETERLAGVFSAAEGDYAEQISLDKVYNKKLANINRGVDTYWLSKPLRTALNHKHAVNITGGTEDLRFGVDLSYNNDNGVMKDSYRDRMSAALMLDYRVGSIQFKNQFSYGQTNSKNSPYGNFSDYTKMLPYDEYTDADGKILKDIKSWHSTSLYANPLYEATLKNFDESRIEEIVNNFAVNWYINNYWLLKGQFSMTKSVSASETFYDPRSRQLDDKLNFSDNIVAGQLNTTDANDFSWDTNVTLSYNRTIGGHFLNFLAGVNATSGNSRSMAITYRGFPSGELSSPNYAQELLGKPEVNQAVTRMFGMLGSFNYTYNNIYLVDVSLRNDGSSEFGSNKRFAQFWSGGLGINIHKYEFMKKYPQVEVLKIRSSYGITGKVNFSPYDALTMYQINNTEWYKTGVGATLMARQNPDLGWEQTDNFDVGIDLQMFKGRLQFSGSFYSKLTKDLVNSVTIPSSTGFTSYMDNVGKVRNRGFEIQLQSNVINTKDWFLSVFANLAHNKNRIMEISDSMKDYNAQVQNKYADYGSSYNRYKPEYASVYLQYVEGGSLTSIFGMRSLGINPVDGAEVYMRPSGEISSTWREGDQVIIGNTEPKAQGTFGFNAKWKNFTLYTTFMYEFGGERYNSTLVSKVENASIQDRNIDRRVLADRWQKPGDISKFKKLDAKNTETTRPTSRFVQDYNVLSFNSISLSYDFDNKWLQKAHIGMLRVELGANDIFRLSSVQLERGLDYPYANNVNLSVKLTF